MRIEAYGQLPAVAERAAFLERGGYFLLRDFALKEATRAALREELLVGIARLAGRRARGAVERAGLGKMHEHFPLAKVPELRRSVLARCRTQLLRMSCEIGKEDLALPTPFYLDDYMFLRISYPHEIARRAQGTTEMSAHGENLRSLASHLTQRPLAYRAAAALYHAGRHALAGLRQAAPAGDAEGPQSAYDLAAYNRNLPKAAWVHGPHIDTWYGHSHNGINLWWAIEGVRPENLMALYPDMFGTDIAFDPRSMYIAPGFAMSCPVKFRLADGDMLVFNPEIPHASHLNTTEWTRVAVTTRLNPAAPAFDARLTRKVSDTWHLSDNVDRDIYDRLTRFPQESCSLVTPAERHAPRRAEMIREIALPVRLGRDAGVAVCPAADLPVGARLIVRFENATILLMRADHRIFATAARCPHLGIDLADGYFDGGSLTCPGHGVTFSLATGEGGCPSMRLRLYAAVIAEGEVRLANTPPAPDGAAAEPALTA